MKQSDQLGPKMGTFLTRYSCEFIITEIIITELDFSFKIDDLPLPTHCNKICVI